MSVDDRRAALVEAALTVMARDGVATATTRAICAEAGMPQSAFHYAFRSKEELLQLAAESVLDATLPSPTDFAGASSVREIVGAALEMFWLATVADPGRQAVVYELTLLDRRAESDPGALGRWQYGRYRALVVGFLESTAAATGVRWRTDPAQLADMIAATVDGTVLAWLATGDDAAVTSSFAALTDALEALAEVPEPAVVGSRSSAT